MAKTLSETRAELRGKHYKFATYLKKATQIKANDISTKTPAHLACNMARDTVFTDAMQKDLIILQTHINLNNVLPHRNENIKIGVLEDISCGRFAKEKNTYAHHYEHLSENIQFCIDEKKVIFIMLALGSYCIVHTENDITKRSELCYSTHSTCLILMPMDNHYEAFYINSHGRDMADTDVYKRIVSSNRTKTVTFDRPAELVLISNLIDYWNTLKDFSDTPIKIKWNDKKTNTYLGVNLQAGDNHGVCFAYPQILLHNFGVTYDIKRKIDKEWGTILINGARDLLKNGELGKFVKLAFMDFDSKYDKTIIEQLLEKSCCEENDDVLEEILEERQTLFTKSMVCSLIRYLGQISFKI